MKWFIFMVLLCVAGCASDTWTARVTVLDQHNAPVPGYTLHVYGSGYYATDDNGECLVRVSYQATVSAGVVSTLVADEQTDIVVRIYYDPTRPNGRW